MRDRGAAGRRRGTAEAVGAAQEGAAQEGEDAEEEEEEEEEAEEEGEAAAVDEQLAADVFGASTARNMWD